ncbi:hypothetical protein [Agriterribacter sp.]|uniref:hypothetical protein n=1 Tax=Agriterribacter sp. TaxID=2821509 RepID=UPI002BBC8D31|nr:hypothetical protein [Agriterribacter sp.]HTN05382.1 hypothetical protein [Agriterribacter sp.]
MFSNVALDVVIGLVFIYLLYSLLATVLSEVFATAFKLKALNLREAIGRMLEDIDIPGVPIPQADEKKDTRLMDSIKFAKKTKGDFVNAFYAHPKIVKLGSSGVFGTPSAYKPSAFSDTIFSLLEIDGMVNKAVLDDPNLTALNKAFAPATARFVKGLWDNSFGDIAKFRWKLEEWFNQTMEQSIEWYKRKIRVITLCIGFIMAWLFNADTFKMINTLSTDDKAREQLVQMATAYIEKGQSTGTQQPGGNPEINKAVTTLGVQINAIDSGIKKSMADAEKMGTTDSLKTAKDSLLRNTTSLESKKKELIDQVARLNGNNSLDSLKNIKKQLEQDIANANTVLGIGAWPADSVTVHYDSTLKKVIYIPQVDPGGLNCSDSKIRDGIIKLDYCKRLAYFFRLPASNFLGFLLTAFAISLGAPFWFDLLNKLISLRTAVKESTKTKGTAVQDAVSPNERVG